MSGASIETQTRVLSLYSTRSYPVGEPLRERERGGRAGPLPHHEPGRAEAADEPAEEARAQDGRRRLGPRVPLRHGQHDRQ